MSNPVTLTFNYALFIQQVPAYANAVMYPQTLMQNYWNIAINYMSNTGNCGSLQGDARQYALNLLVAHLTYLSGLIAAGQVPGLVQNATIDKVAVGLTPPPLKNQFQWWLSLTPYGQSLLALLQLNSVGGFYIGGTAPRAGFSGAYGYGRGVW